MACCADLANRTVLEARAVPGGRIVVEVCLVCGRKHYVFLADPVAFGTRLGES